MKRPMSLSLALVVALSLTACKPPERWTTDASKKSNQVVELEVRDGVTYVKGEEKPITGEHLEFYTDEAEKVKTATTYIEGLKTGPEFHYRKNGGIAREYGYDKGVARYVLVRYDSGLAKMILFYKNETEPEAEQFIGPHIRFHENGYPNTNAIWAADHKQWNKRMLQWDKNGELLGDYLFDEGKITDVYFETDTQKNDREMRYDWNEENLAKEKAAAEEVEAGAETNDTE